MQEIVLFKNIGNTFHFRDKRAKGCFEGRFYCERARFPPINIGGRESNKVELTPHFAGFSVPEKHPLAPPFCYPCVIIIQKNHKIQTLLQYLARRAEVITETITNNAAGKAAFSEKYFRARTTPSPAFCIPISILNVLLLLKLK